MIPRTLRSTLFPYTTLFRSVAHVIGHVDVGARRGVHEIVHILRKPLVDVDDERIFFLRIETRGRVERGLQRHTICVAERSEEHTSELQSHSDLVCRLLLEKK